MFSFFSVFFLSLSSVLTVYLPSFCYSLDHVCLSLWMCSLLSLSLSLSHLRRDSALVQHYDVQHVLYQLQALTSLLRKREVNLLLSLPNEVDFTQAKAGDGWLLAESDPHSFARQLALYEWYLYRKVNLTEIRHKLLKHEDLCPNLNRLIQHTNQVG
jgi:hypothetical protein